MGSSEWHLRLTELSNSSQPISLLVTCTDLLAAHRVTAFGRSPRGRLRVPAGRRCLPYMICYVRALSTPSDISEHLPALRRLAEECSHVTEFGTRTGVSTTAFLQTKATIVAFDIVKRPEVAVLEQAARKERVNFRFVLANVLDVAIEPTDLLFIDTLHVYQQCRSELEQHGHKARKYIAFHDTVTFGETGELPNSVGLVPAIEAYFGARPNGTSRTLDEQQRAHRLQEAGVSKMKPDFGRQPWDLSRELVVQRWAAPLSPTVRVFSPVIDKHHIYGVDALRR